MIEDLPFRLSAFGERFASGSGILDLMDDLGNALAEGGDKLMLGGGNPSHIPRVQSRLRVHMQRLLETPGAFERLVGDYAPPNGTPAFREALAGLLRREFGWEVGPEQVAVTNGSQAAFFCLFNLFAGTGSDGVKRRVLFPMAPEYIGYADLGLEPGLFTARRPRIEELPGRLFKYHPDFDSLEVDDSIGALCVSRPTNPTGNVLSDREMERLAAVSRTAGVPLIVDNAYGAPFPDIIYREAHPLYEDNLILCLSLSKLGLPGARTGLVVAAEPVIRLLGAMNAVVNLASGNLGCMLGQSLIESGEILSLSREVIRPWYRERMERALALCHRQLEGIEYRVHRPEGAMFLWLWFPGLPIDSEQLYQRLKARDVLVVAGHHFFPGLEGEWRHRQECLRITYTQPEEVVAKGLAIIADEARKAYANH
ncbi:MAG: valine--pyruvate transaminase [Gammaproteobacteria bacterium]|nr:MAG: valine--pyruvate transaminase [Gammaproteobacteria bacterium]